MFLDLSKLNPEQRKAVEDIYGPCMIIAGAGSGKTRVLTYKIAYLIESGISPFRILALTFTNKAAGEMKDRVTQLSPANLDSLWIGTFHSMFARLLRREAGSIGYSRNYTIYDTDDSVNVIRRIMQEMNLSSDKVSPESTHAMISKLKNKLVYPSDFAASARTRNEIRLSEIYDSYQILLRKNNSMDFDDLLLKPIELFNSFPLILEKYQDRFHFILVDEYQDTNRAQYEVLKLLAGKHRNISVVGDDAQSIYRWRGAEIKNIFDFELEFDNHKLFRLEQNYRSTRKILSIADEVIKHNIHQIKKTLWTDNKEGEPIVITETMTDRDEAHRIARYISEEIVKRKINFKDFAVLYRTNAQSRLIEDALRQNDLPYLIIGGIRFYQRKEIKDILCYFRVIVNKDDGEAFIRILNLTESIGKTSIEKLIAMASDRKTNIYDALKESGNSSIFGSRTKNKLKEVLNLVQKYQYLKEEMNLSEFSRAIVDEIGIVKNLKEENTPEAVERIGNIDQLISAIVEFSEENEDATLEDFLQKVSLVSDIDDLDNKKNAVTLMTVHAAKGLEFRVIFIAGLEEGLFPVYSSISDEEELEEERRLFYVAVTRAIEKLYISYANQRYRFGIPSYQLKSRFLKEIPDNVWEKNSVYEGFKLNQNERGKLKKQYRYSERKGFRYESISFNLQKEEPIIDDKFPEIRKGVKIYHEKFGNGTVISTIGRGIDKKAEIYFEGMGILKIILKYAKMRIEEP